MTRFEKLQYAGLVSLFAAFTLASCTPPSTCGNGVVETGEACDDGNQFAGDGCENTCTKTPPVNCGNGTLDGAEQCDDGNNVNGDGCDSDCTRATTGPVLGCVDMMKPALTTGTCSVTAGAAGSTTTLISGVILGDGTTWLGGQVLIDAAGTITCASCDCSATEGAATAAKIDCPQAIVSPGLINSHDHISYQGNPAIGTDERYEHRHDWRTANDGHTRINNGGNATNAQIRWAELRGVMAGTTSTVGATYTANGNSGLLRNLDTSAAGQLGLNGGTVNSDTFPLGDSSGVELVSGCGYPKVPAASVVPATSAYLPHVSEGIEASAHNEFVCVSQADGVGILGTRTALVHGIGVNATDVALIAKTGTSLVWSPRSNVSLYGDTAPIALYSRLGVNIALGTDWTISGSMNLLRELKCADSLNKTKFNSVLSDEKLWRSVTANAADATATGAKIGRLTTGFVGDVAIFKRTAAAGASAYRSVIDAQPQDVVLTMRGGKVLYGDANIVSAFDAASACETIDVCTVAKKACVKGELPPLTTGTNPTDTLALLQTANATTYALFYCGAVTNEPSCVPERAMRNVKNMSSVYTAASTMTGDTDGDGIANAQDNCAEIFNPIRPMDNGVQANVDGDAQGDVCDPCPLDANTTTCTVFDATDRDADGVPNATDNCPTTANPGQEDRDGDLKGDVCDPCPDSPNPGAQACVASLYAIKTPGSALLGQKVSLGNVLVTAVGSAGFFLQVPETGDPAYMGPNFSAVYAYSPNSGLTAGDRISVDSTTPSNFHGQVQLGGIAALAPDGGTRVNSSMNALPAPIVVDPAAIAANDGGLAYALEGALVRIDNVTVTNNRPDAGDSDTGEINEFVVTGGLRINDLMFLPTPFPSVDQQFNSITGVLEYRNGNYKIEPRNAADLVYGPSVVSALEPRAAFIREGSSTVIPSPLLVRLSNAESADVPVVITASNSSVTLGDGGLVFVPSGQTTTQIPLTGVTASGDAGVVITATKGTTSKSTTLRVLGANEAAHLISLSPSTLTVSPGGTAMFTVTFDLPVPVATVVNLAVTPATGVGSLPAMVTVPQDAVSASFTFTAGETAGAGMVTAVAGAEMVSANVSVQLISSTHLVISEFAVKGGAGAGDEFIELYNPTNEAIDMEGWSVQYKSKTGDVTSGWATKVTIGAVSLASHQFYLIASPTYAGVAGAVAADMVPMSDLGLAGDSGHVRVVDANNVVVDKVGYGTVNPAAAPNSPEGTPIMTPVTFTNAQSVERKATTGSTAASMATGGVDAARGNGVDTDDNSADFVIRGSRDPQSMQSGVTEP